MKKLLDVIKVSWRGNLVKTGFHSNVPLRKIRAQDILKWVRPEKVPLYHPARSGDTAPMPQIDKSKVYLPFKESKELETANESVKKVFSVGFQNHSSALNFYQNELMEKVKCHPYDTDSVEIQIARLTAQIRFRQTLIKWNGGKFSSLINGVRLLIERRNKLLKRLRGEDYRKFEWLLETLEIVYKPVPIMDKPVTRKRSVMLLAQLKVLQAKEKKLAKLKKAFDEEKIPFMEYKIKKLKEIKEKETKYNLPVTVTDADIEECVQKLEKVKLDVTERARRGYERKIHPFFLEPYNDDLLIQAEKEGEKIREKLHFSDGNKKTATDFAEN